MASRAYEDWHGYHDGREPSGVLTERQATDRVAGLLADRLGPWAPVRSGLSSRPLEVVHCAHCDRYSGEELWHHRSCVLVPMREG